MTATKLRRSTWGLDTGPDRALWWHDARCAEPDVDPEWWVSGTDGHTRTALHICQVHCPVLAQCAAETRAMPPSGVVQGGQAWAQVATVESRRPVPWRAVAEWCHLCRGAS